MAEEFSGNIKLSVAGAFTGNNALSTVAQAINYSKHFNITNGTGIDQANMVWMSQRTLEASATENLDLAGSLVNVYGTTITFTSIKGIIIYAAADNTNDVLVGGAATNQFVNWVADASDIITIKPGGLFALVNPNANGYAVTAGTGDLLRVANSAGTTSVTYDIILLGEV